MDTYIANGQAAVQRSKSSSNQRGGEGSSGQDDHPTSSQLFSTYDGTNNAVLPSSPSPRVPQLPTLHHGLPTANINVNASPIMTVSESEGRLHVDTGGGKNIIVPITRVKFDCAVSEASDGLGPLRQLVQNWHDNAKETTKNLGVKDI